MDLKQKLSEHFMLEEFVFSDVAERLKIDNTPSTQIVECLKQLCLQILEPARSALGQLKINSGYRSPVLNRYVGGSDTSGHKLGYCADVTPLACSKMDFAKWVVKNVKFDQVILEFGKQGDPAWIHVSCDPRSRGQVLQILDSKLGYQPVKI